MIRLLRSRFMIRWLGGLCVALAVGGSALESLIPDVHDGDAVSLGTSSTVAAPGALAQDLGSHHTPGPDLPAAPHHAQHVDHCAHAHVATPAFVAVLDTGTPVHQDAPISIAPTLVSVSGALSLRPPIA